MLLRCKEITALASDALDTEISLTKRMQMRLHLLICKHCSRYVDQIERLGEISRDYAAQVDSSAHAQAAGDTERPALDDERKARLQRALHGRHEAK